MSKIIKLLCLFLAFSLLLPISAYAEGQGARSSSFIISFSSTIYRETNSKTLQIWFDVVGADVQEKLGVREIRVQRSSTGSGDWTTVKTYYAEDYPQMLTENDYTHLGYVEYTATRGYYYRALVVFYAAKGNGSGEIMDYTEAVYVPHSGNGGRSQ